MSVRYYSCPQCHDDLPVGDGDVTANCQNCRKTFAVDRDAEFRDGMWRDLTTLRPVKTNGQI